MTTLVRTIDPEKLAKSFAGHDSDLCDQVSRGISALRLSHPDAISIVPFFAGSGDLMYEVWTRHGEGHRYREGQL